MKTQKLKITIADLDNWALLESLRGECAKNGVRNESVKELKLANEVLRRLNATDSKN